MTGQVSSANSCAGSVRAAAGSSRFIPGACQILHLAAAPTFAVMALLTATARGDASGILCVTAGDASPLTWMIAMYGLMSAFHAAPWLRLMGARLRAPSARTARPTARSAQT